VETLQQRRGGAPPRPHEESAISRSLPSTPPEGERGVCVRGGISCYLCEQPIYDGEVVVLYHDARFWEQLLSYHGTCWEDADLAAKSFGDEDVIQAPALELPVVDCPVCGEPIEDGQMAVRLPRGGGRRMMKAFHSPCFEAVIRP